MIALRCLIEGLDIKPSFRDVFAASEKWFRAYCSTVSCEGGGTLTAHTLQNAQRVPCLRRVVLKQHF